MNDSYYSWFFSEKHTFFCKCEICKIMKNIGFTAHQTKMIIRGMQSCHLSGGDAGGTYSDFETEALPDAIEEMEKIFKENKNDH